VPGYEKIMEKPPKQGFCDEKFTSRVERTATFENEGVREGRN